MNDAGSPTETSLELGLDQARLWFSMLAPGPSASVPVECPVDGLRRLMAREGHMDAARLEFAIAIVEDLIMPVLRDLPHGPHLRVAGPELSRALALAGQGSNGPVPIASIEMLFNQLADRVSGSPSAWPYPVAPELVATPLVILREVMHHGAFVDASTEARGAPA